MASAPLLSAATKLPEWIGSPIADSTLTLSRFSASEQELTALHGLLSNPELWVGGYDLSGKLPDISNAEELWHAMEELWLADGLELMVIQRDGGFAGITGVMEWSTASTLGGWTVLTGRTVIAPELWGSCANEESKIMLYSELFARGVEAVECSVSATNARSLRAVSKFGFRELHREPRIVEGEPREFVRFGIPVAQWSELRERNIDRILQRRLNHELELQQNR